MLAVEKVPILCAVVLVVATICSGCGFDGDGCEILCKKGNRCDDPKWAPDIKECIKNCDNNLEYGGCEPSTFNAVVGCVERISCEAWHQGERCENEYENMIDYEDRICNPVGQLYGSAKCRDIGIDVGNFENLPEGVSVDPVQQGMAVWATGSGDLVTEPAQCGTGDTAAAYLVMPIADFLTTVDELTQFLEQPDPPVGSDVVTAEPYVGAEHLERGVYLACKEARGLPDWLEYDTATAWLDPDFRKCVQFDLGDNAILDLHEHHGAFSIFWSIRGDASRVDAFCISGLHDGNADVEMIDLRLDQSGVCSDWCDISVDCWP
ncbi:hypothetical protein ACFL6C_13165 [Myxococcota bacterium]